MIDHSSIIKSQYIALHSLILYMKEKKAITTLQSFKIRVT